MTPDIPFETATLPYLDSLYRTAFRMVYDQAAAERCVERTYLEARASYGTRDTPDGRVWLYATLFRILHRRRKAWFPAARPSDHYGMLAMLDNIPAILREVVLLADVEGFNRSEIQAILEIPAETVGTRLMEGRIRLRTGLADMAAGAPLAQGPAVV